LGVASRAYIQLPEVPVASVYSTSLSSAATITTQDDSSSTGSKLAAENSKVAPSAVSSISSSMSSLSKLSLKPMVSSLSSSAPEFAPPTLSIDPFMQTAGVSGKHHSGIVGSRFGQHSQQHVPPQLQLQYGGFSSAAGDSDLVASSGELAGSPYSSYFEGVQQALDVNTGGGFFGGIYSGRSNSSKGGDSSSFMSSTFNHTTGIPSPSSFSTSKSGMMYSFGGMDQQSSNSNTGNSLGLGLMGSNFADSNLHHGHLQLLSESQQPQRYGPPGISVPDSSMMSGSTDSSSPLSFTGQSNIANPSTNASSLNRDEAVQGNFTLEED